MREMAATGDLTQADPAAVRRAVGRRGRPAAGDDLQHDDRLDRALPARGGQRERLSSLGRLSTVVAHEIRNPLMIIKTALRGLRGARPAPETLRTAVADIDEEITRLNRIVSDVLDFARPIKFDMAPADLNALCDDAAKAVSVDTDAGGDAGSRPVPGARSPPTPNGCGWPWSTS